MQYVVIIEEASNGGYSAYVPDLPVCFTVGETVEEVKSHSKDAIESYLDEAKEEGVAIPNLKIIATVVHVEVI